MDIYETYIICLFFNKLLSRGMKTKSYLKIYIIHLLFGYKLWIEIYSVNKPLIIVTVSHKTMDINTKPLGQELCFMPLNPVIEVRVKLKITVWLTIIPYISLNISDLVHMSRLRILEALDECGSVTCPIHGIWGTT